MSIATPEIQNSDQTGTAGALSRKNGDDVAVGEAVGKVEKDGANPGEKAQHNVLHLFPFKTLIFMTS